METEGGVCWGEEGEVADEEKSRFLYNTQGENVRGAMRQTTIEVMALTGLEWMSRMIIKGVADRAVELSELVKASESWEDWVEEEEREQESLRSEKEESGCECG